MRNGRYTWTKEQDNRLRDLEDMALFHEPMSPEQEYELALLRAEWRSFCTGGCENWDVRC